MRQRSPLALSLLLLHPDCRPHHIDQVCTHLNQGVNDSEADHSAGVADGAQFGLWHHGKPLEAHENKSA